MDAEQGTPSSWQKPEQPKELENRQYLEIGRLRGVLTQLNFGTKHTVPVAEDAVFLDWSAYRVYKGNVQRLTLMIEGKRAELDTMKRILLSFTF
jgi:hypothetical protein